MTALKTKIFSAHEKGSSIIEVLLAMAILAIVTPFLYKQIIESNHNVRNMAIAKNITNLRGDVLNFVRVNQDLWPDTAQIKLSDEELKEISEMPVAAFIDKYLVRGATITDVYLAFNLKENELQTSQIARYIGTDAAVVGEDGIAYSDNWAVSAPEFKQGYLIYHISRDVSGEDKSKYLHRGTVGNDNLNVMKRNLNMGGNDVYNIGTASGKSAKIREVETMFLLTDILNADNVYFSSGANLDDASTEFGTLRVTGDISGFHDIYADKLNGSSFAVKGRVIADSATVTNSLNVGHDLTLKSAALSTISAFTNIVANSVSTNYISSEEIVFYDNFGLTVSGELLMSKTPPLRIGNWPFPSETPPHFSKLTFGNVKIPRAPEKENFAPLMSSGWQSFMPQTPELPQS